MGGALLGALTLLRRAAYRHELRRPKQETSRAGAGTAAPPYQVAHHDELVVIYTLPPTY